MKIIRTIIENKSGYEKKQERLEIIKNYISKIKLSDAGFDIDKMVSDLIDNDVHIGFKLYEDRAKSLVKRSNHI